VSSLSAFIASLRFDRLSVLVAARLLQVRRGEIQPFPSTVLFVVNSREQRTWHSLTLFVVQNPANNAAFSQLRPANNAAVGQLLIHGVMVGSFLWAAHPMDVLSSSGRTQAALPSLAAVPQTGCLGTIPCVFIGTLRACATKHGLVQFFRRTKLRSNRGRSYCSTAESLDDPQQGTPIGA